MNCRSQFVLLCECIVMSGWAITAADVTEMRHYLAEAGGVAPRAAMAERPGQGVRAYIQPRSPDGALTWPDGCEIYQRPLSRGDREVRSPDRNRATASVLAAEGVRPRRQRTAPVRAYTAWCGRALG
jgi:hypothetical protein